LQVREDHDVCKSSVAMSSSQTPPAIQKGDEETPPPAPASKKSKWGPLKLVSPFQPKKKAAGTALFLKGLGKQRTA